MAEKTIILNRPNFLASEEGLVPITYTFAGTFATPVIEDGRKYIKAGTIYPANDATAKGIVFEDVDITEGDKPGALMIAGRYLTDRLSATVDAKALAVFQAQGLFAQENPTNTLPSDGTLS